MDKYEYVIERLYNFKDLMEIIRIVLCNMILMAWKEALNLLIG